MDRSTTAPAPTKVSAKKKRAALRTIRARAPGAPIRDLDRLAELTRHASVPEGLTPAQRKLLTAAVRDYRAGRDRRGASAMRALVRDLQATNLSRLLPAVFGHLTYRTAVAPHDALDRVARRYAFERSKVVAIDQELARLRKLQRTARAAVTVELKRWHVNPPATGELLRARSTMQLDAAGLAAELEFQTKHRQLAQANIAWLEAVFDPNSSEESIEDAEDHAEEIESAVRDAMDQAKDTAKAVAEHIEEQVEAAENALKEAIENAKNAENAVDTVTNEDGTQASDGTGEPTELERLMALAERLSRECIDEGNAESCAELAEVAAQLADALAQQDQ